MVNAHHLRHFVVKVALQHIGLYSKAAENLIMGTGAQESHLEYLKQIKGPAIGLFQMEPNTYNDIWDNYLKYKPELANNLRSLAGVKPGNVPHVNMMIGNLYYAAAMCRVYYLRIKAALPDADDVEGMAAYWKKYYNTHLGKGTEEQFVKNYAKTK